MVYASKFVRAVFVIEAVWLASVYAIWSYVFCTIGRAPRMSDPATTPPLLWVAFQVSGLLLMLLIPAVPVALLLSIVQAIRRRTERAYVAWAVFGVLLTLVALCDPFGALYWYMD